MSRRAGARRPSLIITLFLRVSALLAVIVAMVGAAAFFSAKAQIDDVYDSELITSAAVLQALIGDELRHGQIAASADHSLEVADDSLLNEQDRRAFESYADWRMFRIWRGGQLALASDTGPELKAPQSATGGFSTLSSKGQTWRIYSLPLPNQSLVVEVGERSHIRDILINKIIFDLALPLLLLLPASLVLIWWSLNDSLRALRAVVQAIGRRNLRDLEPLAVTEWPADIEPLITSINLLFARLDRTFANERRFVDHAAHQLRTPLAALRLQAQLIAREDDADERAIQALQLQQGVDRAAALIDDLLTLARLDADGPRQGVTDLNAEAASVLADFAAIAADQDISLGLEGRSLPVDGDPTLVRLILANLVENAVAHAPPGSEVNVALSTEAGRSIVTVSDQGPGIAPAERRRVFERFHQGPRERSLGRGSGLGLSITEQAARLLRGAVNLEDRADGRSGLTARVVLPHA